MALATRRRGWRGPQYEGEFPTLGWQVLDHASAFLPSPADDTKPLLLTDEQARRILRWYELDPLTGEFVWRRGRLEEAKGWGKSPWAAILCIEEFVGPVCPDGWDAAGDPVGVPWGTGERPSPWIQIAAVSEDQTDNTYGAMFALLAARKGTIATGLGIDLGRTRLYLPNDPGAVLEPVTASFGSREGQRTTFVLEDETHLWRPENRGTRLAATLRRNVAKMGGRSLETCNAPVLGERSVAEESGKDRAPDVLHFATRPTEEPKPDWNDEQLLAQLRVVYAGVPWARPARLLREIRDGETGWEDALRYYFNTRSAGATRAVDPHHWELLVRPREVPEGTPIGIGFDGSISHDATVIRGCTADGYRFTIGHWSRPAGALEWAVPRDEVDRILAEAFARWKVGKMLGDPPGWRTELERWQERWGELVLALDTNQATRMTPIVDRWRTAIAGSAALVADGKEPATSHDDDRFVARQVLACRLRKVHVAEEDGDHTRYMLAKDEGNTIGNDSAVADALAYEAAMTMTIAEPEPVEPWVIVR